MTPPGAEIHQALARLARRLALGGDLAPDRVAAEAAELLGQAALTAGLDCRAELAWLLLCENAGIAGGGGLEARSGPDDSGDDPDDDPDDVPGDDPDDDSDDGPNHPAATDRIEGRAADLGRLFFAFAPPTERARSYFATRPAGDIFAALRAARSASFEALWHTVHPPLDLLPRGAGAAAEPVSVAEHLAGPLVCFACRDRARALDDASPRSLAAASADGEQVSEFSARTSVTGDSFMVRCVVDAGFMRCFLVPEGDQPPAPADFRLALTFRNGAELAANYSFPRDSYGGVNVGALHDMKRGDLISFRLIRLT